jgi:hypothetical protein
MWAVLAPEPMSLAADEFRAAALPHGPQVSGWTACCRLASGKEGEPCPKPWTRSCWAWDRAAS